MIDARLVTSLVILLELSYAGLQYFSAQSTFNERHSTMNLPPQFYLIFLVFGCAAASMAIGKNRNRYLWFVLGLLTGPIALAIILVMKPGPGKDQGYE